MSDEIWEPFQRAMIGTVGEGAAGIGLQDSSPEESMALMDSAVFGPEAVQAVLRRRGFTISAVGSKSRVILPLEYQGALPGVRINEFRRLFNKMAFRKVIREILSKGGNATMVQLEAIAPDRAGEYVSFLVQLGVAVVSGGRVTLVRNVDNVGPTLEWYVADLCAREFDGSAEWSVTLEGTRYGDYDVLAWLPPALVYIETKSSRPSEVTAVELRHFLQRGVELSPDIAILLIDTEDDLDESGLLDRLFDSMASSVRLANGITEPDWRPDEPFIKTQSRYRGIAFGYFRFYVTNSSPSIKGQIEMCLRHYHKEVKGKAFVGGETVNFVTGELEVT